MLTRLRIVLPINRPGFLQRQMPLKMFGQVKTGHQAPGKKIPRHPISIPLILKKVGLIQVAEDMKEQFSIGVKPTRNSLEKRLVVPHMFEHLHRHHAVKPLIDRKFTHICGDHRHILAPELGRLLIDERFLTRGVTHGNDLAVWKLLRHCER